MSNAETDALAKQLGYAIERLRSAEYSWTSAKRAYYKAWEREYEIPGTAAESRQFQDAEKARFEGAKREMDAAREEIERLESRAKAR